MTKYFIFISLLLCKVIFSQNITVDFNSTNGTGKKMTGVNTGPQSVVSGTTKNGLKNMGVELVRTHDYNGPCDYWGYTNFYNSNSKTFNYAFQSHLPTGYNWTNTDNQITEIVNSNLQPFFRLGISAKKGGLAATPMPKDFDQINFHTFAGIAKRTAMHYTDIANAGFNYTIPYWEIWNEPNNQGFWTKDSVKAYYRMYKQCVDSIKSFNPLLKVGGPGAAKNAFWNGGIHYTINQDYVANFFNYCKTNAVPLDFYSFHMYDRTNPYSLRMLTDTLAYYLDQNELRNTELIVSETNINSGGYDNTPKGCSYLASQLISIANSRLSKYIWYRGIDLNPLCNSDIGSSPNLTLNGYAYKFFNELNDSTPLFLVTTGQQYTRADIRDSLNNLMILSGKNSSNNTVKILISNHESIHNELNVTAKNLPWTSADQITVTIEEVTSAGYSTSTYSTIGGASIDINLSSVTDASVYNITLNKENSIALVNQNYKSGSLKIYPTPFSSSTTIQSEKDLIDATLIVYNLNGQQVDQKDNIFGKTIVFNRNNLPNGLYFIELKQDGKVITTEKLIITD